VGHLNHTSPAPAAWPAPDGIARDQHRPATAAVRAECQHLQALEDAIKYRRARVTAPCPDCAASSHKCDDHACDLNLIADYQRTAIAILNPPGQPPAWPPAAIGGNNPASPRDETQRAQPSLP
jgi:hypothetical protein